MKSEKNVEVVEVVKLGRKVNPNSVRQLRLKELELKKLNGEIKRGRPINKDSERQARLKVQALNKAKGIGQGRPINKNSARQQRLAELELKRVDGVIKKGRPAKVKDVVVMEVEI